jgi:membrane associated rhomboid family serine protease
MDHSQIYLPKLSLVNKVIIALSALFYIAGAILQQTSSFNLTGFLGLSAERFLAGHIYTLLTYPLLSHSILEVILNCLMLWLMGSEFESNWGTKRYLSFIFSVIAGGALFFVAIATLFFKSGSVFLFPLTGLSGIVSSLCIAYAVIYPDRLFSFMMLIPIKAKYFCFILVAISLSQGLSGPLGVGAWGQLGGILAAYLFMVVISHRNFKALSQKMANFGIVSKKPKSKAKLTIVKDDQDDSPKYWH